MFVVVVVVVIIITIIIIVIVVIVFNHFIHSRQRYQSFADEVVVVVVVTVGVVLVIMVVSVSVSAEDDPIVDVNNQGTLIPCSPHWEQWIPPSSQSPQKTCWHPLMMQ